MINPYSPYYMAKQPNPPIVMTVAHAQAVIDQFKSEIHAIAESGQKMQAALDATKDVLIQLHPDLAQDIDQIDMFAQQVGISLGKQAELTQLQNQFTSALPYDIKQQIQN